MAAVFKEITIDWSGEEYTITPTFRLIQRIESKDISFAYEADCLNRGKPRMSVIASIIGELLRAAGAKASDEDVYVQMMSGDETFMQEVAVAVIMAAFPEQPSAKSAAPESKAKK